MPHPLLASRSAGVLLHVTSLAHGVLDDEAERFIDWLAEAGQRWWQILPLAPPDHYGSPYAGLSA
ncbi:MAG TPA: 4-alpha-glucanotransferase, partial [Miltoncostaeales bacterium]|nr:4-alpha-glucanotransferase [Miltoncostaeales bacterium]